MTKSIEECFVDWESHVFGIGYGTGEDHTLAALKTFFGAFGRDDRDGSYDHLALEVTCGPQVAWLLINTLVHADIIEYGTSPRFGWLTKQGAALKDFVMSKPLDELVEMCCSRDEHYTHCWPSGCNCGPENFDSDKRCFNPFWVTRYPASRPKPSPEAEREALDRILAK